VGAGPHRPRRPSRPAFGARPGGPLRRRLGGGERGGARRCGPAVGRPGRLHRPGHRSPVVGRGLRGAAAPGAQRGLRPAVAGGELLPLGSPRRRRRRPPASRAGGASCAAGPRHLRHRGERHRGPHACRAAGRPVAPDHRPAAGGGDHRHAAPGLEPGTDRGGQPGGPGGGSGRRTPRGRRVGPNRATLAGQDGRRRLPSRRPGLRRLGRRLRLGARRRSRAGM
ncbi:MAG: hypothetical protein AVDCRST_MAG10-2873, partial [uncultured Acidimicrobiales bacterium]